MFLQSKSTQLDRFLRFFSRSDDGGAEPLHQDQPGAGVRAPIGRRRPRDRLPAAAHHGHAGSGGLVPIQAERERPAGPQRGVHARTAHQLHRLLSVRYDMLLASPVCFSPGDSHGSEPNSGLVPPGLTTTNHEMF